MNQIGQVHLRQTEVKESGLDKRPDEKPSEWAARVAGRNR